MMTETVTAATLQPGDRIPRRDGKPGYEEVVHRRNYVTLFPAGIRVTDLTLKIGEYDGSVAYADGRFDSFQTVNSDTTFELLPTPDEWMEAHGVLVQPEDSMDREPECEGHPAGEFGPMGQMVVCDGTCVKAVERPKYWLGA